MASPIEILSPLVETILYVAPELVEIPVLGRLLLLLSGGKPQTEIQALEEFEKQAENEKRTRKKTQNENDKYVLKVGDALRCVEKTTYDGSVMLKFLKGLVAALAGRSGGSVVDQVYNEIQTCILQHALRQDTPRKLSDKKRYHRPSRGHGKGRKF